MIHKVTHPLPVVGQLYASSLLNWSMTSHHRTNLILVLGCFQWAHCWGCCYILFHTLVYTFSRECSVAWCYLHGIVIPLYMLLLLQGNRTILFPRGFHIYINVIIFIVATGTSSGSVGLKSELLKYCGQLLKGELCSKSIL